MTAETEPAAPVMAYLETTLGLSFSGPRRHRLVTAIEAQRTAAGLSPESFLAAVSSPGRAFDRLIAEVTVGETYFFRDRAQCELLGTVVLPTLADTGRRVTMWSAGCATGEEAFTLAALATEAGLDDRCTVVGSDASRRAVDAAEVASYGAWSMRAASPQEKQAHFQLRDRRWHVSERLRQRTRFVQRNLLDGPPAPGRFDVVLCRNLLIYLTRDAVQRVGVILAEALAPQGWLLTAAGDPPLQAPGLEPLRTRFGLAYRRTDAQAPVPSSPAVAASSCARVPAPSRKHIPPAVPVRRSSGRQPSPRQSPEIPPSEPAPAELLAQQVRSLGDAGRLEEACRAAVQATHAHPLDVELRYLAGVVLLEAGRLEEAAAAATSAVYLGPRLAAAHLLLGQVEHARGSTERARRCFRNGSRLLATVPGEARVALAGDVPAGHLADIATRYLASHTVSG
jgi:chemotaxis protein methyltransferase CheR